MPKIEPDVQAFVRIKVIGVGGSGQNAINHMINSKTGGVEFIAMNTDTQTLHHSKADKKIHLGKNLTKGLGTGMNPEIGRQAAEETKAEIQEALKGADMAFISCGMGGGTGTGSSSVVASIAREQGILTIAVVTKPFFFEGDQRNRIAIRGIEDLSKEVDALIVIPNDKILSASNKDTKFKDAFAMCDEVLRQAVEGIAELITTPGIINIDFADIRTIMHDAGAAFMGIGTASGENRAEEAAIKAINSPLLDISISGAKGVLFAVTGNEDLTMHEVQEVAKIVTESIDKEAKVIFGTIRDEELKKGELRVTVIATGFDPNDQKKSLFGKTNSQQDNQTKTKDRREIHNDLINKNQGNSSREKDYETGEIEDPRSNRYYSDSDSEDQDNDANNDDWTAIPAFLRRKKER